MAPRPNFRRLGLILPRCFKSSVSHRRNLRPAGSKNYFCRTAASRCIFHGTWRFSNREATCETSLDEDRIRGPARRWKSWLFLKRNEARSGSPLETHNLMCIDFFLPFLLFPFVMTIGLQQIIQLPTFGCVCSRLTCLRWNDVSCSVSSVLSII